MDIDNASDETSQGGRYRRGCKRIQFTIKQRMDMYAFCVLELEVHSHKVSIKKQQQAIQKVLTEQHKELGSEIQRNNLGDDPINQQLQLIDNAASHGTNGNGYNNSRMSDNSNTNNQSHSSDGDPLGQSSSNSSPSTPDGSTTLNGATRDQRQQQHQPPPTTDKPNLQLVPQHSRNGDTHQCRKNLDERTETASNGASNLNSLEGKTLLQLQEEVAMSRRCYSDYQKTLVLTSSMLREVQKRFAKYYPDTVIPSRTTIKHIFEKCVSHGTVENIKNPRKASKIPQGDEIEHLLMHEPQLSLRQMAQKLNVSTGTVSRRCKALGLVPESVAIKHQQLASARRMKQIKELTDECKAIDKIKVPRVKSKVD